MLLLPEGFLYSFNIDFQYSLLSRQNHVLVLMTR